MAGAVEYNVKQAEATGSVGSVSSHYTNPAASVGGISLHSASGAGSNAGVRWWCGSRDRGRGAPNADVGVPGLDLLRREDEPVRVAACQHEQVGAAGDGDARQISAR